MWQKLAAAMMEKVVRSALKLVLVTLAMGLSPDIMHGSEFGFSVLVTALSSACFCAVV